MNLMSALAGGGVVVGFELLCALTVLGLFRGAPIECPACGQYWRRAHVCGFEEGDGR